MKAVAIHHSSSACWKHESKYWTPRLWPFTKSTGSVGRIRNVFPDHSLSGERNRPRKQRDRFGRTWVRKGPHGCCCRRTTGGINRSGKFCPEVQNFDLPISISCPKCSSQVHQVLNLIILFLLINMQLPGWVKALLCVCLEFSLSCKFFKAESVPVV